MCLKVSVKLRKIQLSGQKTCEYQPSSENKQLDVRHQVYFVFRTTRQETIKTCRSVIKSRKQMMLYMHMIHPLVSKRVLPDTSLQIPFNKSHLYDHDLRFGNRSIGCSPALNAQCHIEMRIINLLDFQRSSYSSSTK